MHVPVVFFWGGLNRFLEGLANRDRIGPDTFSSDRRRWWSSYDRENCETMRARLLRACANGCTPRSPRRADRDQTDPAQPFVRSRASARAGRDPRLLAARATTF